ncbi:hypothetical protein TL08_07425 [Actinoalloteichus hymeniacidonis]|uniref:DUF3558 family protein n=1 Tax=Actinoalloteichus hymeniacidonis TaxID=340345 RepID=A0AAC9HN18_9PSEU|nr:hypothetical protein TL08_07425 [Actinoalloteichus hymeniacidonis]
MLLLATAGCAGSTDLAKANFERTTVAAADREVSEQSSETDGSGGSSEPQEQDEALTRDALRDVNPCALVDEDLFEEIAGSAPDFSRTAYSRCGVYGTDPDGEPVSLNFTLGDSVFSEAEQASGEVAGLKTHIQSVDGDGGGVCFLRVITTDLPDAKSFTVQMDAMVDDVCDTGRQFAEHAIELLRSDPPLNEAGDQGLGGVDPCTILEPEETAAWVGEGSLTDSYGLHDCAWSLSGVELRTSFEVYFDPADTDGAEEIDLGGITAYRILDENVFPECEVRWVHADFEDSGDYEVVTVSMADIMVSGIDTCALATEAAAVVKERITA